MLFKINLTIIIFLWAFDLNAQGNRFTKPYKNHLEIGVNFSYFFDKKPLIIDQNIKTFFTNFANDFDPIKTPKKMIYFYLGYKFFYRTKSCFSITHQNFSSPYYQTDNITKNVLTGRSYRLINIGWGYLLPVKKIQLICTANIAYRYLGQETVVFRYNNPGGTLSEPLEAYISYNSIGPSFGIDANYNIFSNLGFGAKLCYNIFPFENGKLIGNNIEKTDPDIVELHKPNKQLLILNLKLVYQFNINNPFKKNTEEPSGRKSKNL